MFNPWVKAAQLLGCEQNDLHFADAIFKCIFWEEILRILI